MVEASSLFKFFSTKREAEEFMFYLEERGSKELGLGEGALIFGIDSRTAESLAKMKSSQILSLFKKLYSSLKVVKLAIAFEPRHEFIEKVKNWLEGTSGTYTLVDLEIDKNLIGGAIVIANNHYRDFSLVSKIQPES